MQSKKQSKFLINLVSNVSSCPKYSIAFATLVLSTYNNNNYVDNRMCVREKVLVHRKVNIISIDLSGKVYFHSRVGIKVHVIFAQLGY